jgi:hypothetical protein
MIGTPRPWYDIIDWIFYFIRVGFWLFMYILFLGIISFRVQYEDGLSIQLPGWPAWLYLKYLKFRNLLPENKSSTAVAQTIIKESIEKQKGRKRDKSGKSKYDAL